MCSGRSPLRNFLEPFTTWLQRRAVDRDTRKEFALHQAEIFE